jgi:phosphoserine aminotransferase
MMHPPGWAIHRWQAAAVLVDVLVLVHGESTERSRVIEKPSGHRMTDARVFNFSPGPAVLPLSVLQRAQEEFLNYGGSDMSLLEMSHRAKGFLEILDSAQALLRELLGIGPEFEVLFLQGGSRLQFSMVPMNLLRGTTMAADYLVTGSWSKYALQEAEREGQVRVLWDGKPFNYDRLPDEHALTCNAQAAYLYYCSNETIQGVQFQHEPASGMIPLVCDASSDFLSRPLDLSRYGVLYACAQKNAGPAGVTVVVIRKDLLARSPANLPGYCNYNNHAAEKSLWNTPPTFSIYLLRLVLLWLRDDVGGLANMAARNREKAQLIYDEIDQSGGYYRGHAQKAYRSHMNVTFRLPSEELEMKFVTEAIQHQLDGLAGHRSVGGIRASIYNAMPREGVVALRDFMQSFRNRHG